MTADKTSVPFRILAASVFFLLCPGPVLPAEVAVIEVGYRDATELLPIVETLLAPGGRVSADPRTNSLVVVADAESIGRVRAFLADMDRPARQAVVRVRFDQDSSSADRSIETHGRASGKGWSVGTPGARRDGVKVQVQDRSVNAGGRTEAMLRIMSGSRGYIRVGEDIPYTSRWLALSRRYARLVKSVGFQRVDTGFEVRPVILGDQADIEIIPRISEVGSGGNDGVIRFSEAATRIRVPLGRWVTISGGDKNANEAVRAVLSYGSSHQRSSRTMSIFVSAD